jgi:hypothetical protein
MNSRSIGLIFVTIGTVLIMFNYGIRLEFLSYPLVFPSLMIFFGVVKIVVGVLNLQDYKGALDFIIFVWLVMTFVAYGIPSFNVIDLINPSQVYDQPVDLSQVQSAVIDVGVGKIALQSGTPTLNARYFGNAPSTSETPSALSFDSSMSDVTLTCGRAFMPDSTLSLEMGMGSIEIDSTVGFQNITVNNGLGSIDITLPAGTEYSITYSVGLGSYTGPTSCTFSCSGTYATDSYETASEKLNIVASVGMGAINVHTV